MKAAARRRDKSLTQFRPVSSLNYMALVSDQGEVGVYDLKTHLSEVLALVQDGRHVTVTRHGKPIAVLAPPPSAAGELRRAAIGRILDGRRGRTLPEGTSIRDLIEQGRRL